MLTAEGVKVKYRRQKGSNKADEVITDPRDFFVELCELEAAWDEITHKLSEE